MIPKIAMCNIYGDIFQLKELALEHGFSGIDFSFDLNEIPKKPSEESLWISKISNLTPLEVRFHCPFLKIDLGHNDPEHAMAAKNLFQHIIRLVSRANGKHLSIHIGLGRDSTEPLSWETTIDNLKHLVQFGAEHRVKISLENLAWGWTSKPNLFEKIIRKSGSWVTFDIGHALVCDSVKYHYYEIEDFVTPHPERVINAHIYHKEIPGVGHLPPESLDDIESCLSLLQEIGCEWWVTEVKNEEGLLKTKRILDEYILKGSTFNENNPHTIGRPRRQVL